MAKKSNLKLKTGEKAIISMPVTIKGVDKENYTLTMVASTQKEDRHGDIVLQDGWDLKPYKKNPVILNSHNYNDATEVIAKAVSTKVEGTGVNAKLVQVWKFAVDENPKAKIIFDLYAGGYLHASSVGFIPKSFKEGDYFTIETAELLEVSAVSVPANATATLAKSIGVDTKELEAAVVVEPEPETETEPETEPEPDVPVETDEPEPVTDPEPIAPVEPVAPVAPVEPDVPDVPEPIVQLSVNTKTLNAIKSIELAHREKVAKAYQLIKTLHTDHGITYLPGDSKAKARKEKINKAIRLLVAAK